MAIPVLKQSSLHLRRGRLAALLALLFLVPLAHSAQAVGSWTDGGDMHVARQSHTATLLPGGKVLVAGGSANNTFDGGTSAELFNQTTGNWALTGDMHNTRYGQTATLLQNGKVLVVGGFGPPPAGSRHPAYLDSAELYDPATGDWTVTGSLSTARGGHTATLLPNGKVLVVGGHYFTIPLALAELYDPATGIWTATGSLNTSRQEHTATLLPNGKVLVAGGYNYPPGALASTELYDPAAGTWTLAASMTTGRYTHTGTLLPSGKVLVAGGSGDKTAELYDPAAGTWIATGSLSHLFGVYTATLLSTGKVLVTGAGDGTASSYTSTELYDPATGSWSDAGAMSTIRSNTTATLLRDGEVLVAGGYSNSTYYASTELYDPTVVSTAPVITLQPVSGGPAATDTGFEKTLTASASGNPTPTVQWQVSTNNGATFTNISGATSATYKFPVTISQLRNQYRAVFTNSRGSVTTTVATIALDCSGSSPRRDTIVAPTGTVISTGTPYFQWSGGWCIVERYFYAGNSFGSADLFSSGPLFGGFDSIAVSPAIPVDGRTIYVRLWSLVYDPALNQATWQADDRTYVMNAVACQNGTKAGITNPENGATIPTGTPTFYWYYGTCVTQYHLYAGSRYGSADLFDSGPLAGNVYSATITPALPADSQLIYVRLWSLVNGTWMSSDTSYAVTACQHPSAAVIISPTGTTVTTGTPTFQWGGGGCVSGYYLDVGSSYFGHELFHSVLLANTVTSLTVSPAIPLDGSTIYVTLGTVVDGTLQQREQSYVMGTSACTNPAKADITTPAPGTIHGASQTFSWSGGACVTQYYLYIGSSYGSADLYSSGQLASTVISKSVGGLPTNGSTIYVRLWSLVNGSWQAIDHSYVTAP